MCWISSVIRSTVFLYLLTCYFCHALYQIGKPVLSKDSLLERESLVTAYDTLKEIREKSHDGSNNTSDYDDKVFGANSDNENIYKFLHESSKGMCLLDNLKSNLLWWSHDNGSLVANGEKPYL